MNLGINDLCYEFSQDGVCLSSFDCVFVLKEVRYTNKTDIKGGLQYTNKKLSLPDDVHAFFISNAFFNSVKVLLNFVMN